MCVSNAVFFCPDAQIVVVVVTLALRTLVSVVVLQSVLLAGESGFIGGPVFGLRFPCPLSRCTARGFHWPEKEKDNEMRIGQAHRRGNTLFSVRWAVAGARRHKKATRAALGFFCHDLLPIVGFGRDPISLARAFLPFLFLLLFLSLRTLAPFSLITKPTAVCLQKSCIVVVEPKGDDHCALAPYGSPRRRKAMVAYRLFPRLWEGCAQTAALDGATPKNTFFFRKQKEKRGKKE
ncbi:hypothetical protein TW95_gp1661 [Pandoravirus inopinatum]|uniref:Transmembrane protein n=1 Tax=Pandoravirus inopinatum TaxID=1605721 RepID=A0A0B5J8W1_9VIRU|nr:hypothetical protein TW95_gp1661 [Pandoravirus inopinatum]AJF98395.1 hypothetical protein [Pandoravirus inopinatum]